MKTNGDYNVKRKREYVSKLVDEVKSPSNGNLLRKQCCKDEMCVTFLPILTT